MTQQNAALVEESAAAADTLKDQASRLDAVVQHFALTDASRCAKAFKPRAADPARARDDVETAGAGEATPQSDWKLMAKAS